MRLIDLDQIEYFTLVDKLGVPRYKIEIGEDIGIEEVKAIPIEYIEAFKKKVRDVTNGKAVIDWLLEDWEEEQARLFEKQITEECVSAERFAEREKENEGTRSDI